MSLLLKVKASLQVYKHYTRDKQDRSLNPFPQSLQVKLYLLIYLQHVHCETTANYVHVRTMGVWIMLTIFIAGAVFYSSGLETHGQTWRLKVYPNGNGMVLETLSCSNLCTGVARAHYLSVFLEMTSYKGITPSSSSSNSNNSNPPSLPPPAKYDYRIELINQKFPHVVTTREFASDFEVGECWGYNRFFRIDNLVKDGYLIPDDDVIVLRFHVRPQTYYQHCRYAIVV